MTRRRSNSITIRDVARRAGVSVATASRYLNRSGPVSPETAERLEKVMQELEFVPHATARSLATHRTNLIGLRLSEIQGEFFAPLVGGIEAACAEAGFDLLLSCARKRKDAGGTHLPLGAHNIDGLLVFADSLEDADLARLHAAKFPLVLIYRSAPAGLEIPAVTVENEVSTRQLVSHLIETHTRRRILFLSGLAGQEDSRWRELGYREALERAGLPFDPALVAMGEFDRDAAGLAIKRLLANRVEFDAVFTGDDEAAVGVLRALRAAGLRVPEDVSVAGFDDQRMSPYLDPPLTTVRAPTAEVGQAAARQLIALIRGQRLPAGHRDGMAAQTTVLPTEMILRRSCGCNALEDL